MAAYGATKVAVKGLTEAMSVELARFGARAADVSPGIIDTPLWRNGERFVRGSIVQSAIFLRSIETAPMRAEPFQRALSQNPSGLPIKEIVCTGMFRPRSSSGIEPKRWTLSGYATSSLLNKKSE